MNLRKFATKVTKREGGKIQCSVAQVAQMIAKAFDELHCQSMYDHKEFQDTISRLSDNAHRRYMRRYKARKRK